MKKFYPSFNCIPSTFFTLAHFFMLLKKPQYPAQLAVCKKPIYFANPILFSTSKKEYIYTSTHHLQFLKSSRMVLLPLQISEIFEVVKLISSVIVTVILWKSTEKKLCLELSTRPVITYDDEMICQSHKMCLL